MRRTLGEGSGSRRWRRSHRSTPLSFARRRTLIASLVTFVLLSCAGCTQPPQPTKVHFLTANPNPVAAGSAFTLAWSASNVGSHNGTEPYCTLQRTRYGLAPDPVAVVACIGAINLTAPLSPTTMTYQLSALRRDGKGYATRSVGMRVSGDATGITVAPTTATLHASGSPPFTATATSTSNTSVTASATVEVSAERAVSGPELRPVR